jgi:TonB-dependent SusC/RagA subfamily outer membrane receptor
MLLSVVIASGNVTAQNTGKKVKITGIVTDVNKNPVAGAMVLVDNNTTSIVTNAKGFFKIKVNPEAQLITVFSPNNGTGEALINGKITFNIILDRYSAPPPGTLNESGGETVNVGYGSMEKKNISTPVSKLDMRNSKFASYTNIYEMLKGTLPGVHVAGNKITIMGASSFMLSTDPLFIVDGMEAGSIDNISPSQVESVEVLKGPAASIYGSRGANGVILITLIGSSPKNTRK